MQLALGGLYLLLAVIPKALCYPSSVHISARSDASCPLPQILGDAFPDIPAPSPGNNGTDDATEWDASSKKARRRSALGRRTLDQDPWWKAIEKGGALWAQLQKVLQDAQASDKLVCGLGNRWTTSPMKLRGKGSDMWGSPPTGAPYLAGMPLSRPTFVDVSVSAPKGSRSPDFSYHNSCSPDYGVIKVTNINGIQKDDGSRAPDRWSDVTWKVWSRLCAIGDRDPAGLTWIAQVDIRNLATQELIDYIIGIKYGYPDPPDSDSSKDGIVDSVYPGTDTFYALLGSPNVIGTVYMLMDFVNGIGRKTVKEIGFFRLFPGSEYTLYIRLDKADTDSTQPADSTRTKAVDVQ